MGGQARIDASASEGKRHDSRGLEDGRDKVGLVGCEVGRGEERGVGGRVAVEMTRCVQVRTSHEAWTQKDDWTYTLSSNR